MFSGFRVFGVSRDGLLVFSLLVRALSVCFCWVCARRRSKAYLRKYSPLPPSSYPLKVPMKESARESFINANADLEA